MIPLLNYGETLSLIAEAIKRTSLNGGAIIECGTWKGGMAAGMLKICGADRKYFYFDSFEGLPLTQEIDGKQAETWQKDTQSNTYHDNNFASFEEFSATIATAGAHNVQYKIYKGWFSDTIPTYPGEKIAVLRLDGDWYESTIVSLRGLWDFLMEDGLLLIDDYFHWDGCSRAVHDFLSERKLNARIEVAPFGTVFIRKRSQDIDMGV
jgi:O-methyltransferase